MSKSKFENISNNPIPEEKSAEEIKKEMLDAGSYETGGIYSKEIYSKEQKEHIELREPKKLFELKQGDEFLIPGSDRRYRVSVKYKEDKITAREKGTSNIIELNDGNLEVIHVFYEESAEEVIEKPEEENEKHK